MVALAEEVQVILSDRGPKRIGIPPLGHRSVGPLDPQVIGIHLRGGTLDSFEDIAGIQALKFENGLRSVMDRHQLHRHSPGDHRTPHHAAPVTQGMQTQERVRRAVDQARQAVQFRRRQQHGLELNPHRPREECQTRERFMPKNPTPSWKRLFRRRSDRRRTNGCHNARSPRSGQYRGFR